MVWDKRAAPVFCSATRLHGRGGRLEIKAMMTPEDQKQRRIRGELLHRAVALGEELMRLADDLDMTVAGLHVCQGVEMMREEAERLVGPTH